jgi:hypothetical protein
MNEKLTQDKDLNEFDLKSADDSSRPKLKKKSSGRPKNSGIYGEQTMMFRVPISLVPHLEFILSHWKPYKKNSNGVVPFPFDYEQQQ